MKQIDEFAPALREALQPAQDVLTHGDVEAMAAALSRHARQSTERRAAVRPVAGRRASSLRRHWIPGALLAGAAGLSVAGLLLSHSGTHPGQVSNAYATRATETMEVQLPTGASVRLAPESRLQYRVTRDGTTIVALQGQAFFTVRHAEASPFQVETGNVVTTVLGTEFDVRYYDTRLPVTVEVASGKVSSGAKGKHVVLTPGMRGELTDSTAVAIPPDQELVAGSWRNGQLAFRNTPVEEVLDAVSRWTGYDFKLADSALASQRVTTVLVVDTPAVTFELLKSLLNVSMTFEGRVVTLHPRVVTGTVEAKMKRNVPRTVPLALEIGK